MNAEGIGWGGELLEGSGRPSVREAWGAAPRALRVAAALVVPVLVLGLLRSWLADHYSAQFVLAYGRSVGLDMHSWVGQQTAQRDHPIIGDSALFGALLGGPVCLAFLLRGMTWRRWSLRVAAVCMGLTGLNALGSLGDPAPWWYDVLAVVLALVCALATVVMQLPVSRRWAATD